MILIDFLQSVEITDTAQQKRAVQLPQMYVATDFAVMHVERRDNQGNEEMSEFNRNAVTSVTYWIYATVNLPEGAGTAYIKEYDTEPEAVAVYDEIVEAVMRGDKLYSFRRTKDNANIGDSSER